MEIKPTKTQLQAADAIAQAIAKDLSDLDHAETAVAAAARIAGTFLFRDFQFPAKDIAPGTAVLSDKANDAAPLLFNTLGATLQVLKVPTDPEKRSRFHGNKHPQHSPRLSVTETQGRLEQEIRGIAASYRLNPREAAQSCAIAAGVLIKEYAPSLDPNVASAVAAFGFIEGLKTMPPPLAEMSSKPWYAFWR